MSFDHLAEEAVRSRLEQIGEHYEARREGLEAKRFGAPPTDEVLPYLVEQLLNMLFHSNNVSEVFSDDVEIRKKVTPIHYNTWPVIAQDAVAWAVRVKKETKAEPCVVEPGGWVDV